MNDTAYVVSAIGEIKDPFERFVAFIVERENIRLKRVDDELFPWTDDPILSQYRFTNINRENDRVSLHYQKHIRKVYQDSPLILPATVLYRWFNRPETCEMFFRPPTCASTCPFETYIETNNLGCLMEALDDTPTPHVTGAFIITGRTGYPKGQGVLIYFNEWCKKPWRKMYEDWQTTPPTLAEMFHSMTAEGLGSFMTAQLVADLKYLPFMLNVPDWWTWASSGPGSERGLNFVLGHTMLHHWSRGIWLQDLRALQRKITPVLEKHQICRLHAQDLQNCLCEFSKYEKVRLGLGRPRQVFRHV